MSLGFEGMNTGYSVSLFSVERVKTGYGGSFFRASLCRQRRVRLVWGLSKQLPPQTEPEACDPNRHQPNTKRVLGSGHIYKVS